ncbi:MAG: flavin reductase family protein [Candidatus Bipolaricaulia bacterium]
MQIDPKTLNPVQSHRLLIGCIVPRPIGFVSTVGEDGVPNAAPFSFFNGVSTNPPMVMISVSHRRGGEKKDTLKNIERSREFVVNVIDEALADRMNQAATDFPSGLSEFTEAGLTARQSVMVQVPRIGEAPIQMECKLTHLTEVSRASTVIIGEVIQLHVRDDLLQDGVVDIERLQPIGRLGGNLYCRVQEVFSMERPTYTPEPGIQSTRKEASR